jgi:hypothetical protein
MEQKLCGIYCLTAPNGKVYVGQSTDLKKRYGGFFNSKKSFASEYRGLVDAIKLYPREQWRHEILCYCSKEELDEMEKFWIKELDAANPEKGYNKTLGGKGACGVKVSEVARKRMSENCIHRGKFGAESITAKPINQYDLDENFIRRWGSAVDAERALGFKRATLHPCLSGRTKSAKGFIWRHEVGSNDPLG